MGYLVVAILGLSLLFIFPGIISSLAVILGFFFNILSFPIELISMYVYPVGIIVYFTFYIIFGYLVYEFIHHHVMNK